MVPCLPSVSVSVSVLCLFLFLCHVLRPMESNRIESPIPGFPMEGQTIGQRVHSSLIRLVLALSRLQASQLETRIDYEARGSAYVLGYVVHLWAKICGIFCRYSYECMYVPYGQETLICCMSFQICVLCTYCTALCRIVARQCLTVVNRRCTKTLLCGKSGISEHLD